MTNSNGIRYAPPPLPPKLTAEAAEKFGKGINLILSRWTALQMAVSFQWGGPHTVGKPQQLASQLLHLFTQSKEKVYIDDVEDVIDEFMDSINTVVDDGSIEEIAEMLMVMHEECSASNFNSIEKLEEADPPRGVASSIREAHNDDDEIVVDDDSSEMAIDACYSRPSLNQKDVMVDEPRIQESAQVEDGWTVVGSRGMKGRRN